MTKIDEVIQRAIENHEVAGMNVLVMQNGEEIAYSEAGYRDIEAAKPYKRDTIVRLYSMTKPITAAAAMLLMERGQLDLGQSVDCFLPGFQNQMVWENGRKVQARRKVLVRDLLSMTSGLSYGGDVTSPSSMEAAAVYDEIDARLYGEHPMTTLEIANQLGQCGLAFHPGEKWMYGTSADVLGAVIEVVSGMSFGEFLQKEFFAPLEMKDTGFYVPAEKMDRLAKVYETTPEGMQEYVTNNLGIMYPQNKKPAFEAGGAGLVSTLEDYAHFAQMLLAGGKYKDKQILQPRTVQFFTEPKMTPWQLESVWKSWESMYGYGYGNLMRVLEEPGLAVLEGSKGEYGWDGWLGAYFCNCPKENATILMSVQKRDAGTMEVTRKVRNVIASHIL